MRPQVLDVCQYDIFVVPLSNHISLHNALSTAIAVLFCVHIWHGDSGVAAEVVAVEEVVDNE
jgi:hypothetical protein